MPTQPHPARDSQSRAALLAEYERLLALEVAAKQRGDRAAEERLHRRAQKALERVAS